MRSNTKEIHVLSDGDLASTHLGSSVPPLSVALPRSPDILNFWPVIALTSQEHLTPTRMAISFMFKSRYPLYAVLWPRVLLVNGREFLPLMERDSGPDLSQPSESLGKESCPTGSRRPRTFARQPWQIVHFPLSRVEHRSGTRQNPARSASVPEWAQLQVSIHLRRGGTYRWPLPQRGGQSSAEPMGRGARRLPGSLPGLLELRPSRV